VNLFANLPHHASVGHDRRFSAIERLESLHPLQPVPGAGPSGQVPVGLLAMAAADPGQRRALHERESFHTLRAKLSTASFDGFCHGE